MDSKPTKTFLKNAWYVAAWSYEVEKSLFERTIIGESILMYRQTDGTAVAMGNTCPHRYSPLNRGKLLDDVESVWKLQVEWENIWSRWKDTPFKVGYGIVVQSMVSSLSIA